MSVESNKRAINTIVNDQQVQHLEMIQHVIERMSQNSFALKGWAMTLVVAVCALAANGSERKIAFVAYVPITVFWFLDSYYLQKERKFRALYNNVLVGDSSKSFNMDISHINDKRTKYFFCLFSITEWLFYLGMLFGITVVFYWIILSASGGVQVNG